MASTMKCEERMYLTRDRQQLVGEGDERAAFLYATPGDEIPETAVTKFGLKEGKLPKNKGGKVPANKGKGAGENKGAGDGADKAPQLTDIAGIGPATAKGLEAAGIVDVAALAGVDAANPPTVEKLPPNFDWAKVVEAAAALVPDEGAGQ